MGDEVAPDAPTQWALEPLSVQAWGLEEPDAPPPRVRPGLITTLAVAGSLAAVAVAGILAWQHLRPEPASTPTMVPAAPTVAPKVLPPVTVTVQTPAPTAQPKTPDPPTPMAVYDQRFLAAMASDGWYITDPTLMTTRAHQVCAEFAHGTPPSVVNQKIIDASGVTMTEALTFTANAMIVYPGCRVP